MTHRVATRERLFNRVTRLLARVGAGPRKWHVLTVVGRKTGRTYSTPISVVTLDGQRWLVAPYKYAEWFKNAAAAGVVGLDRRGFHERLAVEPVAGLEAARVLRAYLTIEPIFRKRFGLSPEDPADAFLRIVPEHPVLRASLPRD